ncbi:hypothetical protein D2Q93_08960 [Alicyclobacillaceae bacterium I2511]|nr:hypothetical protein D2Q93_08960 [Alicyclobacillaceae bacterium I2511]
MEQSDSRSKKVLLWIGAVGALVGLTGCSAVGSVSPTPNGGNTTATQAENLSNGVGVGTTSVGNGVGNQAPGGGTKDSIGGASGSEGVAGAGGAGGAVNNNTGTTTGATSVANGIGPSNLVGTGGGAVKTGPSQAGYGQTGADEGAGQAQNSFPAIVQMAMGHVANTLRNSGVAPTVQPWDADGSNQVFYQTWQTLQGPIRNYSVLFSSPTHRLGGFSVSRYNSIGTATEDFRGQSGFPKSLPGATTTVQLATGLSGQAHVLQAQGDNAKEISFGAVTWQEGRWLLIVSENGGTTLPMGTVNQVIAYLSQHFMPVPQTQGAIVVQLQPGLTATGQPDLTHPSLQMYVTWQLDNRLLQVQTYTHCQNPVDTALAMAISMRPYV